MYSNTYFVSEKAILSWGDAGLSGEWATRPVALYSVPERSGAWGLFRAETSTMSAYFKPSIQIRETAAEVVDAVAADPNGIGFAPAGFISDKVKVLPVKSGVDAGATLAGYAKNDEARRRANEFVPPTAAFFESEVYPLTRYFRMYVDQKPGQAMDPAMREFLKFGLSREGQAMMEAAGYLPVPPRVAAEQVAKLK
jgi:phosphate transport system substrate-binding protein